MVKYFIFCCLILCLPLDYYVFSAFLASYKSLIVVGLGFVNYCELAFARLIRFMEASFDLGATEWQTWML